ncbi:DUF1330 domain-containing protein [Paenibacillus sp. UKAQ_18]|nr:DUF1330 domain-containing protein [Paenibacillus sp. UKAQ_18]
MSAYLIIDVEIHNPEKFKEYEEQIVAISGYSGGNIISHDNHVQVMGGLGA